MTDKRSDSPSEYENQLGRLLDEAVGLTASRWRPFLEKACDDPEVAQEVEALLRAEANLGDFLNSPLLDSTPIGEAGEPFSSEMPRTLGPFAIREVLGRGGMGTVYRAEQREPVRRQVALKVIDRPFLDRQSALRFEAEKQALARLDHPNVARLFEAGRIRAPGGTSTPYFAMELVDGAPIARYCDDRRLSLHERLKLFVAVCRGIQHAHEKQILHRDLKPSNILVTEVDGLPTPKIIDFGIAKALGEQLIDETLRTGRWLLGTPHYMSPEALEKDPRSDVDTRSDVYSLGVVLFELLTGHRPFHSPSTELPRLIREIVETRPIRPSQLVAQLTPSERAEVAASRGTDAARLAPQLSGELDWIVIKAMAKNRNERYASAAELADELERILRGEAVLARPPSFGYRLRKWAFRNRLAAGLGTATALGLILATVLTSLALVRARRAELQSRNDAQVSRQALGFVVDLFEAASPQVAQGETIEAKDLLALGTSKIHDAEMAQLPRAEILAALAQVQAHLGNYPEAVALAQESLDLRREVLPDDDPAILSNVELLANALRRDGRFSEAEPLLEGLVDTQRSGGNRLGLAGALNSYGNVLWSLDRLEDAESAHREALAIRVTERGEDDPEVASSHNNLGVLFLTRGRNAEAEPHFRRAAEVFEAQLGKRHPNTANALTNLGTTLQRLGRYTDALELQEQVLEIGSTVQGPDHPTTSAAHTNLLVLQSILGQYDAAAVHGRRALEICESAWGPDHGETLKARSNLGSVLRHLGRFDEAEALLREAVTGRRKLFGDDDARVLGTRRNLALVWRDTGRIDEARSELESILASQRRILGDGHRDVASTLHHLGVLERRAGNRPRAIERLEEAATRRRAIGEPAARDLSDTLMELAGLETRNAAKTALLGEAMEIRQRALPAGHPDTAAARRALADVR